MSNRRTSARNDRIYAMPPIKLGRDSFADFKTALRDLCPSLRSSHADEVLASAFGHRTYASLSAAFAASQSIDVKFDQVRLLVRLVELGYAPVEKEIAKLLRRHFELAHERMWAIPPANDNRSGA